MIPIESANDSKIFKLISRGDIHGIKIKVDKMRKAGEISFICINRYIEYSHKVFKRIEKLYEDGFAGEEYYEETREIKLYFNLLASYDEILASPCIDLRKINNLIIDYDMVKKAIKSNPLQIENIPNELLKDELYKIAIKKDGGLLALVPENKRTLNLCKIAVKNEKFARNFVPIKYKDKLFKEKSLTI